MTGQRLTQQPSRVSHSNRAIRRSFPFAQVGLLVLLSVSAAFGQWLEKTIYLPDEFGGLIWPNCVAFDTVRNKVYFGGGMGEPWDGSGTDEDWEVWIVVVDAQSLRRTAHIPVPNSVLGLCLNPSMGKLYCSLKSDDQVGVIDCAADSLVSTIAVGVEPDSLCLDPDDNKLYCAGLYGVTVIDCSADTVLATITTPGSPRQLTYASANHTVYCRSETAVTLIDTRGDSVRGVLDLGPEHYGTRGACWNPLENKYYCLKDTAVSRDWVLCVIDGFGDSLLTQMEVPSTGLCFNPADNRVYCVYVDSIHVVDCRADTLEGAFAIPGEDYPELQITCSPRSGRLYCVPEPSGDNWRGVLVADCVGDSFVKSLPTGVMPSVMGYDPKQDRLFTINYETDDATVVDCAEDSVRATICLGFKAQDVVYASNEDKVYVGGESYEGIIAIDAATNRVVAEIPTGTYVTDMCYNPVLNKLYTVYPADDTVVVIDCRTDSVVARVGVGDRPWYLAFSPLGGSRVYCSNTNDSFVSVIDCVRDSVVKKVYLRGIAWDMLANPRENKIYCRGGGVQVIDCRGDTIVKDSCYWGEPIIYNPVENKAYFGCYDTLYVVDGHADTVVAVLPLADSLGTNYPYWGSGCCNTRSNKVYLSAYVFLTGRAFAVLDGTSDTLSGFYWDPAGGVGMWAPLYNSVNNKVYLPYEGSDFVAVLDGATDSVLTTVAVSANPRGLAWSPISNRTFVACYYGSCVSAMRDSLVPGVQESCAPQAAGQKPEPTIVTSTLRLGHCKQETENRAELMDATGRSVMELVPGENDVRQLSPGVYFLRSAGGDVREAVTVRKVVVTR